METELLTSPANPLVKEIRRAAAHGTLTRQGCAVAEGFHLLEEALRSGCEIQAVVASQAARAAVDECTAALSRARRITLAETHFRAIASTENPQGVLTLVRPPEWTAEELFGAAPLVVVLDGIQDPGNAGAIVRAAEAFGASGAMFLKGTVSPYNPKAMRASAGSVFRVPLATGLDAGQALATLRSHGLDVYAAMPAAPASIAGADLRRACAFLIGSEGSGLSERLRAGALEVRIPVSGVESLNAALAAGVLLYEVRRQRSGA